MDKMKVIFFGDSICLGQHVSIHNSWVSKISLEIERSGIKSTIYNSSVNGRTSRQALEDMPYHIQSQNPDILIIQFGMNDCNYWLTDRGIPRVSEKSFESNLEEMIERSHRFDVKRIILNNNHPTGLFKDKIPYTNITYEDSNRKYNDVIRKVARNNDVIFNDIERYFNEDQREIFDLLLPDGIHPNENGHQLYFDAVYPVLLREIESI